jgi:nitroreductase
MLKDLVRRNRSYRRFHQEVPVRLETLREFVDLARLSASGANLQPLKYILANEAGRNQAVFETLAWAGYLKDWSGPEEGERPAAYIIILGDTMIRESFGVDPGIAAQSILLGATEQGMGGCIVASIQRDVLREALNIDPRYEILLVLALGKPKEVVVIDPVGPDGEIKYWREADGTHHVPKRALDEIIIG